MTCAWLEKRWKNTSLRSIPNSQNHKRASLKKTGTS
jgi:hypothetical protein